MEELEEDILNGRTLYDNLLRDYKHNKFKESYYKKSNKEVVENYLKENFDISLKELEAFIKNMNMRD